MGLFAAFTGPTEGTPRRSALDEAHDPSLADDAVTKLVTQLLAVGIDGAGPWASVTSLADDARRRAGGVEDAVERVVRQHLATGAAGGFVTGVGGFWTMAIAIPLNVVTVYAQATRMVAAVASLRGYDVADQRIRTAVLLTLVGSDSADILTRTGISVTSTTALDLAGRSLPRSALMLVQKAVGFRLLRGIGEPLFARAGKLVPVLGGFLGGGIDLAMMKRIADHARTEVPARS